MDKEIKVSKYDLEEYTIKSKRTNPILRYWIDILKNMPMELKNEACRKFTNLVELSKHESAVAFRFKTKEASEDLERYLREFVVFVEGKLNNEKRSGLF